MISKTEEVQELIKQLESTSKTLIEADPSKDFPYSVEIDRLRKLSEASILLGKLFTELGECIKYDARLKNEELQATSEFDFMDYTLLFHPIDHHNLEDLVKEVRKHIFTEGEMEKVRKAYPPKTKVGQRKVHFEDITYEQF